MNSRSPGPKLKVGSKCNLILQKCLALQIQKVGLYANNDVSNKFNHTSSDYLDTSTLQDVSQNTQPFWMYDSGYLVFQGFLEANLKCFWNTSLLEAVRHLEFHGYVSPGILLVAGNARALEIIRAAWSRNVLKPPINYTIVNVGDIEDCLIQSIPQGQFTPLPEALCWIIFDLTSAGQPAVIEAIIAALTIAFPDIQRPSHDLVYDTLAKLMSEKKIYQTSQGYFVVTPETRRLGRTPTSSRRGTGGGSRRNFLMSADEAMTLVHGEMETTRDGIVTHQNIQTNLADVIMGGNANDKILYPRSTACKNGSGSTACSKFERRHSMRVYNNSKRFTNLQRSGSLRYITDKGSGQESMPECAVSEPDTSYKSLHRRSLSLLSRFFRRSVRSKRCSSPSSKKLATYSDQFPPREWFNQSVKHLHSVGTQTMAPCEIPPECPSQVSKDSLIYWEPDDIPSTLKRHSPRSHSACSSSRGTPRSGRKSSRDPPAPDLPLPPIPKSESPSRAGSHYSASTRLSSPMRNPLSPSTSSNKISTPTLSTRISSPTSKSFSSSSSGYNSLPRSVYKSHKLRNGYTSSCHNKTNLLNSTNCISEDIKPPAFPPVPPTQNSIIFQVSTSQGAPSSSPGQSNIVTSSVTSSSPTNEKTTLTTTINGNNTTKIFLQQNTPVRSLITFENGPNSKSDKKDLIVVNIPKEEPKQATSHVNHANSPSPPNHTSKIPRPTSFVCDETEGKDQSTTLESNMRTKCQSTETLHKENKEDVKADNTTRNLKNKLRAANVPSSKENTLTKTDLEKIVNAKNPSLFSSETELNNTRKATVVNNSFQEVDKNNFHHISYKNLLKNNSFDTIIEKSLPKKDSCTLSKDDSCLILDSESSYPECKDFPLEFSSLAAQNILKGISLNSIDTLVECNMAAEKRHNQEVTLHTDFGLV
ncbi:TRIO and F-actin-binding protein isoform X1 [Diaphorina citri]|uniref:TRIO and F-actin-binding protein isoform X1 n=2 Tax=Diaphorina citri TaxID=121845 RepID=A0A3Q0IKP3_DIACI|nr:TRIO and F-actin-binding protein isoform X1 [Diaphorina citri]XP_026676846.1 TRIO and F-actin-binding protein isoform X2 [Diaphorina citri]XP_026676847.1 TRIO and F-actin-binding protein isoform X1 [Diaphorina citri]